MNDFTKYFHNSYEKCREDFLGRVKLLKSKGHMVIQEALNVPGKTDDNLFIDTALIKSGKEKNNLLIISSGVHGIEGYVGSALQNILLDKLIDDGKAFNDFDFFFIHGVNPWGFKHNRRVNENNVDLNRNFAVTDELFSTKNKPYTELNHLFNPQKKMSRNFLNASIFVAKVLSRAITKSKRYIVEAIGLGQYEFEKGVIFGGFNFQYEKEALEPIIKDVISEYKTIVSLDLHTGLGKRGEIYLLNAPKSSKKMKEYTNLLFNGKMVSDDDEDFYDEHGSFLDFISALCSSGQLSIPVMFEFGTTNSDTLRGIIQVIIRLRDENQCYHYGYKTMKDKEEIRKDVEEALNPSSEKWRQSIASKFVENIELLENINSIN